MGRHSRYGPSWPPDQLLLKSPGLRALSPWFAICKERGENDLNALPVEVGWPGFVSLAVTVPERPREKVRLEGGVFT